HHLMHSLSDHSLWKKIMPRNNQRKMRHPKKMRLPKTTRFYPELPDYKSSVRLLNKVMLLYTAKMSESSGYYRRQIKSVFGKDDVVQYCIQRSPATRI